ncbi:MAG: hypothetical protein OXD48_00885, partial [Litoreibacter sp.]|nr:hypothetical protein [Litoreibacter sp.]
MSQAACILGVAGFGWLTVFQLMLAAGLPLGHLAWGGAHRVLPSRLRISSLFSAVLTLLGVEIVAQAGGLISLLPPAWITPLLWIYAVLFAVSFLLNLLGAKGWERIHGVPLTLICAG